MGDEWLNKAIEEAERTVAFKMESLLLDFTGLVCKKMTELSMTVKQLAIKTDMPLRCIHAILGCTHNVELEAVVRICIALDIEITFKEFT